MTEEYDVFGDLDALCSDKLENFKNTVPAAEPSQDYKSDDDSVALSDNLSDASTILGNKLTNQDSLPDFNEVLGLGNSKTKKKRGRKSKNSEKETLPSMGYGFSTTLASKRASPGKDTSCDSLAAQDLLLPTKESSTRTLELPTPTIEGTTALRRLTRSMGKVGSSGVEQPPTNVMPVAEIPQAAALQEVIQAQLAGGRRSNRGRKRRTQAATENMPINQALAEMLGALRGRSRRNPIQNMYSRRQHAALMAAQSSNVDYVDLVSSPLPRIDGVINVDSDTEEKTETNTDSALANSESLKENKNLDLSFDEENPEISVKVLWNGNPEIFKLRKYQKFATIFASIAQREDTDEKNLVFNINNKILSANDTPASINYKIFEFINGRVLVSKFNSPMINEKKKREANKITLKIQSDQWKRPMQVELLKTEKFKILYIKCAEELNIPYENLKLSFDGESLEFDATPADLDLEGGEAIDLRIKK